MPEVLLPARELALERFRSIPSGRERAGRFWKIDVETIAPPAGAGESAGTLAYSTAPSRAVVCDLETARREHADLLARAFGVAIDSQRKFVSLTLAYTRLGAFVYIPADAAVDEPIVITYEGAAGESIFPHTVVLAERGARATVVERMTLGSGAFACGIAEVITAEGADVTYAGLQNAPLDATVIVSRAARPGRDATVRFATAELGAALALGDINVALEEPGSEAAVASLFFPGGDQHVDLASAIDHRTGDTTSNTLVKSAAIGSGQGRYVGTIRIAPHAQRSEATLRDDALLLSKQAHIDSVPALEIAANDVKAYHGATVGALEDEQIFYMCSRGIEPNEAERMIALGFFEPVVDRFPAVLQEEIRDALIQRVDAQ